MYNYNAEDMIIRIKKAKKQKGFTNEQLAEISGVPVGTLNKVLGTATKEPLLSTIIKISKVLDVSVNEIIFGDTQADTPTPPDANKEVPTAQRIARAYDRADLPVKRTVEVALEPYMEDKAPQGD